MKQLFVFLLFFFLNQASNSQNWEQNKQQTTVSFKIKNFGINVDGSFNKVAIETNFNKDSLPQSYINAEILVKSITTGVKARDEHLLKEDYFHQEKYKSIRLKSKKIEFVDGRNYLLTADLTIKGTTKSIKILMEINQTKNTLNISSDFEINRKNFSVGGGSFILGKNVEIEVNYSGNN